MIGGMAAPEGVSLMNQGGCGLTGLSGKWNQLVAKYYGLDDGMPFPPFPRMKESELAFWELLNSSSTIDTSLGCHAVSVELPSKVGCIGQVDFTCIDKENHQNTSFLKVNATYMIDASHDGDIMVMAGVDHTSGREGRSKYNESLAGVQIKEWINLESFARQNISVDPYDRRGSCSKTSVQTHYNLLVLATTNSWHFSILHVSLQRQATKCRSIHRRGTIQTTFFCC